MKTFFESFKRLWFVFLMLGMMIVLAVMVYRM